MSKEYELIATGHPSIYAPATRQLNVYFSLPDMMNSETGILLLIAGFGGKSSSNVFTKMRRVFADEYNLVVLQCDYFGFEYMQQEVLKETPESFCDMGIIQAMDNLIAIKCVSDFLDENAFGFDRKNIIAYGNSQGAYLALLMNSFMPGILSCVIDNSAWVIPQYLKYDRLVGENRFHYIISEIILDEEIYDLNKRYNAFTNAANIISFYGISDNLVEISDKAFFLSQIQNSSLEIVNIGRVDNRMFFSTGHGLGADFLEMFRYVMKRYNTSSDENRLLFFERKFETEKCSYEICIEEGIPILFCTPKYDYDFSLLERYY